MSITIVKTFTLSEEQVRRIASDIAHGKDTTFKDITPGPDMKRQWLINGDWCDAYTIHTGPEDPGFPSRLVPIEKKCYSDMGSNYTE